MRRSAPLWLFAFLITLVSAVYQRMTGPSYPLRGSTELGGVELRYKLLRSQGDGDAEIRVATPSPQATGTLAWKRFKTNDNWTYVKLERQGMDLVGRLPHQPPAGKLAYRVILQQLDERVTLGGAPTIIRFKGEVPPLVLGVHIFCMFFGMLLATRTGLETFAAAPAYPRLILATVLLLTVGGLLLGPIVQKYAFGAFWTGWPFGTDLTDNKTAVAWLAWLAAYLKVSRGGQARWWVLAAAILTMVVFAIPHSLLGSELKY